jgi:maleamate amidohydrolase
VTDRFEEVGYGQSKIGFGTRPAVVVVDFQNGFTRPEWLAGRSPHIHRAVDNTAKLLKDARRRNIPVAVCNVAWSSRRGMPYWKVSSLYQGMSYGDPSVTPDDRVYDPDYDYLLTKAAPSMFFGTSLATFLNRNHVDTVFVTGCTTSGCVRATIIDSFSYGYRTIVPEECCGDMEEGPHWDNLRDVGRRYADVVTLADSLSYFEKMGRFPEDRWSPDGAGADQPAHEMSN